jgi:PadR family transcriptional regulator
MEGDQLRGHLDPMILAAVAAGPAHGYEVIERLREGSGGELDLAEGTVYPALHRLEARCALVASWQQVQGRRRKVYAITADGRRLLAEQRRRWQQTSALVTHLLGAPT